MVRIALLCCAVSSVGAALCAQENLPDTFRQGVLPFLDRHCSGCHNADKKKGMLDLERFGTHTEATQAPQVWLKARDMLASGKMPPASRARPEADTSAQVLRWIDRLLEETDRAAAKDPGRVTTRRLNCSEYNNTVRDLLGIEFKPADDFPADDVGYGFDNVGDVLSMPPLLFEKYLDAAEKIAESVIVGRPKPGEAVPESHRRLVGCDGVKGGKRECAKAVLDELIRRAWRRPPLRDEVDRLVGLVMTTFREGRGTFEEGMQLALKAVLVSPHFLFRVEDDSGPNPARAIQPVGQFAMASRLSYFLWSTMPDDELFRLAQEGKLQDDAVLDAQVRRMVRDPRSHALTDNFAAQWLTLRNLTTFAPDREQFPAFDEELRSAMLRESELFFEEVLRENVSVLLFLDADFSFLNERLARHYGIPGVTGGEFRRVSLAGSGRGGVLTQASVLAVTSNPTRTSPVKRGKWVLEQLLGAPPPPPPGNAGDVDDRPEARLTGTLRQRFEQHRSKPECANCHESMDPLGFAFENYDAIGAFRTHDGKFEVDASGVLPSGRAFRGATELKAILLEQRDAFVRCLVEKLLTFALGRGLEYHDRPAVDRVAQAAAKDGYRMLTILVEIAKSVPFRMRRALGVRL